MKKYIFFNIFVLFCSMNLFAQKGHLGEKFSLSTNLNFGSLFAMYNEVNANYIIGKKVEIFGSAGTSFNSHYYANLSKEDMAANNMEYLGHPGIIFNASPKTSAKLSIFTYGGGIRFYRKTKLAPVGSFIEIGYTNYSATVKNYDEIIKTNNYTGETTITKVEKINMHEFNLGLHRKRVYKDGLFFSWGFKLPIVRLSNAPGLNNANDYQLRTLKNNKFFFCFTFGKMLF